MDRGVMVVGERWRCRGSQGSETWQNDMGRMAYRWCGLLAQRVAEAGGAFLQ